MHRILTLLLFILGFSLNSESITLRIPEPSEGGHEYFPRILEEAFRTSGHILTLKYIKIENLSHTWELLAKDELDLAWFLPHTLIQNNFTLVNFNLTKGLGGHQVLLIPRGKKYQDPYSAVKNLSDFRNLGKIAGVLQNYRDSEIWKFNNLRTLEWPGSVKDLREGLSYLDSGFDYIPRSLLEASQEILKSPQLTVETDLVLIYPEDFRFALSPNTSRWAPLILDSLQKADRTGVINRLINLEFRPQFENLSLQNRRKIFLKIPSDQD